MTKRLVKSSDKKLYGVAGGLAEYFNADPTIVRVGFVVFCFVCLPIALLTYVALAIMMPSPTAAARVSTSDEPLESAENNGDEETGGQRNLLAWALIGVGAAIVISKLSFFTVANSWLLAAALVGIGVVLLTRRSRAS